MFCLTRRALNQTRQSLSSGTAPSLRVLFRTVQEKYEAFKYVDCAFCLKGLRELVEASPKKFTPKELEMLTDAETKVLKRLKSEPADYFSITIWAQSLRNADVDAFVDKLQSDAVIEGINTFSIASILVSLSRLDWRDEYLIDRMIIRINKTPHQLNSLTISNILNSLVKLRYENSDVIDVIYKEGTTKKDFTPQGIAMSLNAMSHFVPLNMPSHQAFLDALVDRTSTLIDSFDGQATAVVLNSLSKLRMPREAAVTEKLFARLPKVIHASNGHSISLVCKALASFNVVSDEIFSMIAERLEKVLQEVNEQGIHFVLNYTALFNSRESCQQTKSKMLGCIAEHVTRVGGTFTSMGVTYTLQGLVKCQFMSNELMKVTLFSRACSILEKHAEIKPSKFLSKPPSFNGQEVGILLNATQAFEYENQRLISLVLTHIQTWASSYTMTDIITTLWGIAKVRKVLPAQSAELKSVATDLYGRIQYATLSGRAVGSIALSYAGIGVENEELIENLRRIVQNRAEQIEMKYLSIVLTTMYSMRVSEFDDLLEHAIAHMSLNVNNVHPNALARLLHLAKTCNVQISKPQLEAICALVEIIFPKVKSFELSHILTALKSFTPSKTATQSLDQYANIYVRQMLKDASKATLERLVEYFAFSKGASEETLLALLDEMQKHPIHNAKHAQWVERCCESLNKGYPQCSSMSDFENIRAYLKAFQQTVQQ